MIRLDAHCVARRRQQHGARNEARRLAKLHRNASANKTKDQQQRNARIDGKGNCQHAQGKYDGKGLHADLNLFL